MPKNERAYIVSLFDFAVDTIIDAYGHAAADAAAFAYNQTNRFGERGGTRDPDIAEDRKHGQKSVQWLDDVTKLARQAMFLANLARRRWPDQLQPGQTHDGVTVGKRTNTVETCEHCKEPVPEGRLANGKPTIIRVNGLPYHRTTCYYRHYRANGANAQNSRSDT